MNMEDASYLHLSRCDFLALKLALRSSRLRFKLPCHVRLRPRFGNCKPLTHKIRPCLSPNRRPPDARALLDPLSASPETCRRKFEAIPGTGSPKKCLGLLGFGFALKAWALPLCKLGLSDSCVTDPVAYDLPAAFPDNPMSRLLVLVGNFGRVGSRGPQEQPPGAFGPCTWLLKDYKKGKGQFSGSA